MTEQRHRRRAGAALTAPSPLPERRSGGAREDTGLRPAVFARRLLDALVASEGRRRKRKRDTTPDAIGLGIKRDLLEGAIRDDPEPEDFEGWLLEQTWSAPASGPVRALCGEVFAEFRLAAIDPDYESWLAAGAPSADAEPTCDVHPPGECPAEHADQLAGRRDRRRDRNVVGGGE